MKQRGRNGKRTKERTWPDKAGKHKRARERKRGGGGGEEKKENGKESMRGRNFLGAPRIQSHRVYSSVHLILFIGSKAFAGTAYLRI